MKVRAHLPLLSFLLILGFAIAAAGSVDAQVNADVRIARLAIVGGTLTITGQNFGGGTPSVEVAGGTAVVSSSSDTEIVAETGALPSGTHLVKVTRDATAGGSAVSTLRVE